jgi:hypothetical protein
MALYASVRSLRPQVEGATETPEGAHANMNASAIGSATRAIGLAVVIALAATVGLMVGNALQGVTNTNAGYPEGWQGGAAAPLSRTADTSFSLDAIADVQAARGDAAAAAKPDYVDYAQRHTQATAESSEQSTESTLANPTPR